MFIINNVIYFLIKRWSKTESFTIFENHVYPSRKCYVCPNFLPFLEPKLSSFYVTYYIRIFPIFLPFCEPNSEHFLSLTREEFCPNLLPFLEPKLEHFLLLSFASSFNAIRRMSVDLTCIFSTVILHIPNKTKVYD